MHVHKGMAKIYYGNAEIGGIFGTLIDFEFI